MLSLLLIGAIVVLIAWVTLVVLAFKESVWWGIPMLIGPFVLNFTTGMDWLAEIIYLVLVLAFTLRRISERPMQIALAGYVVGTIIAIPGYQAALEQYGPAAKARMEAQKRGSPASGEAPRAIPSEPSAAQTYVPPPVQAAVVPSTPQRDRTPSAPSTERATLEMPTIVQVYVHNAMKKYYPLDCSARPEGSYKMARSMAIRQGYTLAAECVEQR